MLINVLIGLAVCVALAFTYLASLGMLKHAVDMEIGARNEVLGDPTGAMDASAQPRENLTVYQMQRRFSMLVKH
jgi:hypothetical protein